MTTSPTLSHVAERASAMLEALRAHGLRMTRQRVAIVRLFADDESHPTAQELFERLQPEFSTMSFATVYNTLSALSQAGVSTTIRLGNAARFDPNKLPHHHAVCDACGAVTDVPAKSLVAARASHRRVAKAAPGFDVTRVERIYRGRCARCSLARTARPSRAKRRTATATKSSPSKGEHHGGSRSQEAKRTRI